ncbi:MAG: 30S ribosomal protein S6 [Desulfobulbaceae bacterium]|nr:30S ribosomal protein S6 [Desulfobulbaceae bacterium]
MRHYETTYILRPNLGDAIFTEIIDRTNSIIAEFGGTLIAQERIGMRKLAYVIKKEVQGYYVYINFAAPGEAVAEIERIFRIDDRVLRYLTIKLGESIDAEGIEAERERIAAAAAARAARDAAEAEDEAKNRGRRRDSSADSESGSAAGRQADDVDDADDDDDVDDDE